MDPSLVRIRRVAPPPGDTEQTACVVSDVDGDGDNDFFIADRSLELSLFLYIRTSNGWIRSVLDKQRLAIDAGGDMADIDGDGDLDLALGQDGSGVGDVWWRQNPLPESPVTASWTRRLIKSGGRQAHAQRFADFVGDSQSEFANWVNKTGRIEIYDIPADPTTSPGTCQPRSSRTAKG